MNFPSLFLLLPLADVIARQWDPIILLVAKLAVVMALVLLNGFFVVAEFALVKIRDSQLNTLAAEGIKRAALVKQIKNLSLLGCFNHFSFWQESNRRR